MRKFVCSVCGYIYDEAKGIPEAGIAPGTVWEALPDDWVCPICGASKENFEAQDESVAASAVGPAASAVAPATPVVATAASAVGLAAQKLVAVTETSSDLKEMSPLELSALCANLKRGCEKQYKPEEAALFNELAEYFKKAAAPATGATGLGIGIGRLLMLIEKDLEEGFPNAMAVSRADGDRGALRALVWSEKVTRILKTLLTRYQKEGDAMLEHTGVYVCSVCGFIYIGDDLPDICPVCKVPSWKFERIEEGR